MASKKALPIHKWVDELPTKEDGLDDKWLEEAIKMFADPSLTTPPRRRAPKPKRKKAPITGLRNGDIIQDRDDMVIYIYMSGNVWQISDEDREMRMTKPKQAQHYDKLTNIKTIMQGFT